MEDETIIDLYFAREERAISETGKKYGGYCRSIAFNILHSHEDTEECVSDTWLHTWNAIPPTRPGCLRAFLGRITRNLSFTAAGRRSCCFPNFPTVCRAANGPRHSWTHRPSR